MNEIDYATTGLTIGAAMIDKCKRFPDKDARPGYIRWNGMRIQTAEWWDIPKTGRIRLEFLQACSNPEQGVDIKIEKGAIILSNEDKIPVLRTWKDDRYENVVEYPYISKSGRMCTWNVYNTRYPSGEIRTNKWTGNAGFWVEELEKNFRVYHCSPGDLDKPDFSSLIFKLSVFEA